MWDEGTLSKVICKCGGTNGGSFAKSSDPSGILL